MTFSFALFLRRGFGLIVAGLMMSQAAPAQEASWLGGLPRSADVFAQFAGGADPVQSLGRQCAALDMLERTFMRSPAIYTNAVAADPATAEVAEDYRQGFAALREQYVAAVGEMTEARANEWTRMCERGGSGLVDPPVTLEDVLAIVSPEVRAGYDAAVGESDRLLAEQRARQEEAAALAAQNEAALQAREAERGMWRMIGVGILLIGLGMMFLSYRGIVRRSKYEFDNTTDGGVVKFDSFGKAVRHGIGVQLGIGGAAIGAVLAITGLFVIF